MENRGTRVPLPDAARGRFQTTHRHGHWAPTPTGRPFSWVALRTFNTLNRMCARGSGPSARSCHRAFACGRTFRLGKRRAGAMARSLGDVRSQACMRASRAPLVSSFRRDSGDRDPCRDCGERAPVSVTATLSGIRVTFPDPAAVGIWKRGRSGERPDFLCVLPGTAAGGRCRSPQGLPCKGLARRPADFPGTFRPTLRGGRLRLGDR